MTQKIAFMFGSILVDKSMLAGVDDLIAELAKHFQLAIVTTSRDVDFDLIHAMDGQPRSAPAVNVSKLAIGSEKATTAV